MGSKGRLNVQDWKHTRDRALAFVKARPVLRDFLIFVGFVALTAIMTWPWVLHLRNAVSDPGDPYMIAWSLWWDYHQTFHDPLHLFQANVFYPYQYTLAFSENDYGIALLFFPLFAIGVRPLTVHAVATFLGFAFSGYGAFRLTRTLTRSTGAAWIGGIFFAFVPFRFHVLSHLHYLFAGWLPLLLEALVLFIRVRSWRRSAWLGIAFFMNALTCISWLIMSFLPLVLTGIFLISRHRRLWDRALWVRGALTLGLANLALLPFLIPYYRVTQLYGFHWLPWEYAFNSPSLIHWLAAEPRNRVWSKLGANFPGGHKLFPGLIAPLLAFAAFRLRHWKRKVVDTRERRRLMIVLDVVVIVAAVFAIVTFAYGDMQFKIFGLKLSFKADRAPGQAVKVIIAILICRILYPFWFILRHRTAVVIGLIWMTWGFVSSLGKTFYFNLVLHDYFPLFRSLRLPSRWAMICYVGMAVLAGIGAERMASYARRWRVNPATTIVILFVVLAFELHASPLDYYPGAVDADAVALRLRDTPMRGGLVELPSDLGTMRHRYMLRSADHGRPLVNATASFVSPVTTQINDATRDQAPDLSFLDLLEKIPASYLVIHNDALPPEQRSGYELFLAAGVSNQRLRFINRFDGRDDLYAVVRNEPEARSEAQLPFRAPVVEWAALISQDPINLLSKYRPMSEAVYRFYIASYHQMPRYSQFLLDMQAVGHGLIVTGSEDQSAMEARLRGFADEWVRGSKFDSFYRSMNNEQYVDSLIRNSGTDLGSFERAEIINRLNSGGLSRAAVLLQIVNTKSFAEKENTRSLVLLHYFAYLRRNPDEPPDNNLNGFNYWVSEIDKSGEPDRLKRAFMASFEYTGLQSKSGEVNPKP